MEKANNIATAARACSSGVQSLTRNRVGLCLNLMPLLLFILVSCDQNAEQANNISFTPADSIEAPVVIPAGKPIVTRLDTCPPPTQIPVAEKAGTYVIKNTTPAEKITLSPPEVKPADFFVTMQNFNTDQGLALSTLISGFKDKAGNLWFGTAGNGVSKYDGKTFTTFNSSSGLIHNLINDITEDREGNIWFGTYGGLSKYDGISFTNFTTADGLVQNDVESVLEDRNGTLWLGTRGGISKFDGKKFMNYTVEDGLPSLVVREVIEDRNGQILIATPRGVFKYNSDEKRQKENTFTNYFSVPGMKSDNVLSIIEDKKGAIWLATDEGVSKYDPSKNKDGANPFVNYTTEDGLAGDFVTTIIEDSKGTMWFGTETGVSRYNPPKDNKSRGTFFNLTTKQGLAHNHINSITEDNSGSLWFGTRGAGLSKYDGEAVVSYSTAQGLPNDAISAMTADKDGNLWFGGYDGELSTYDGNTFTNYSSKQVLSNGTALALLNDTKGNLWFGDFNTLSKFDGTSFTSYSQTQGLLANSAVSIMQDKAGNLWLGSYEAGIVKFDGSTFAGYTTAQGLVHNTVWSTLEDSDGNIWFATRGGLSKFDGQTFTNFTKAQGLVENKLSKIIQDKNGNLIIGSWGSGVSIIRKEHLKKLTSQNNGTPYTSIFESFTTSEGLSNDVVYDIVEDSKGNIIIGSSKGFTILKGGIDPSGENLAKAGIENYNQQTGYPIKDLANNNSMYIDADDILWAGTGDKLVRFDYSSVNRSTKGPAVFIESIKVNNEKVSWYLLQKARSQKTVVRQKNVGVEPFIRDELRVYGKKLNDQQRDSIITKFSDVRFDGVRPFYAIPENLVLPYAKNDISFDFVGVETSRPFLVRYQYMLEGYDEDWSPVTDQTTASFGNIPGGNYTFMVKAQSPDGVWSEPLMYSFNILPPWYLSWFAYLFYTLVFFGGVYSVHRVQKSRTIRKEREKTQKRELEQARKIDKAYRELKKARKKELFQSKEIKKAYKNLESSHTQLQAAQEQLVQQEKLASLGQLTAGIAHEIKNPLNFVNNFSEVSIELLEEAKEELSAFSNQPSEGNSQTSSCTEGTPSEQEGKNDEGDHQKSPLDRVRPPAEGGAGVPTPVGTEGDVKEQAKNFDIDYTLSILNDIETNLRKIHEHGSRADRIVKSMLQHSRGGSGTMEPTNLNMLVKEFVNLAFHGMRAGKNPMNMDIELELDERVGKIPLIAEDFSRVIVNLCNNAFDAMREKLDAGGRPQDAEDYEPKLTVKTIGGNDQVIVEITDNGPGIPEEIKVKIMQPFFTTKKGTEGTGLGLYITNDIVKAHGGTIDIKSTEGKRTTFKIHLPHQMN
jgi:ligand-binding sensor domain-containing protein/signal transduction histidine kinase